MSQTTNHPEPPRQRDPDDRDIQQPDPHADARLPWIYRTIDRIARGDRRALLTRIGIAVALLVALLLVSPSFFGWGLAVAATIVAVPISRLRAYATAFLPYGAAWLIFTMLRALADETRVPLRTDSVTRIERAMFLGNTPTIWLQSHLFDPLSISWYDYATTFVHWSYFFVPHLAAILIWRRNPALFTRYLVATVLLLGMGLLVYFLSPAAPPWLTTDTAPQADTYRVMANVGRQINSGLYDRTYSVVGDSNPVAAMPSMHQAITFLVTLFAIRAGGWIRIGGILYAIAMGFSLVYTGEHYVIDVLVGSALATYAYFIAGRWLTSIAPLFQVLRRHSRGELQPTTPPPI
ncbi:MAG: phosphatase PAP2 family protein [Thermomicrobiales bacterium]